MSGDDTNILTHVLESEESQEIAAYVKSQVAEQAIAALEDHFNVTPSRLLPDDAAVTDEKAASLMELALFSRFHQQDGQGGGHTILSPQEAYNELDVLFQ
jgi:methylthioribose-1-phosphate isomerase